jgi:hypothetical protein
VRCFVLSPRRQGASLDHTPFSAASGSNNRCRWSRSKRSKRAQQTVLSAPDLDVGLGYPSRRSARSLERSRMTPSTYIFSFSSRFPKTGRSRWSSVGRLPLSPCRQPHASPCDCKNSHLVRAYNKNSVRGRDRLGRVVRCGRW